MSAAREHDGGKKGQAATPMPNTRPPRREQTSPVLQRQIDTQQGSDLRGFDGPGAVAPSIQRLNNQHLVGGLDLLYLQRTVGNQAVQKLLQSETPPVSQPGALAESNVIQRAGVRDLITKFQTPSVPANQPRANQNVPGRASVTNLRGIHEQAIVKVGGNVGKKSSSQLGNKAKPQKDEMQVSPPPVTESEPNGTAPMQTVTAPVETTPVETTPAQTVTAPVETTPAQTVTAPTQTTPVETELAEEDPFAAMSLDFVDSSTTVPEEVVANPDPRMGTLQSGATYLKEVYDEGKEVYTGNFSSDAATEDIPIRILMERTQPGKDHAHGYYFVSDHVGQGWAAASDVVMEKIDYEATTEPLFPIDANGLQRKPKLSDIMQGNLGDCYLLGAIGSLVARDPDYVMRMFEDRGDRVRVRLFQPDADVKDNPTFTERHIVVEKSLPKYSGGNAPFHKGALWVSVLEKAYAAAGLGGDLKDTNDVASGKIKPSYAFVHGGASRYALATLTGHRTRSEDVQDNVNSSNLFNSLTFASKAELELYKNTAKPNKNYSQLAAWNLFEGDEKKIDRWMSWLEKNYQHFKALSTDPANTEYANTIRREQFQTIFVNQGLDPDLRQDIQEYVDGIFPGKRGTGDYSLFDIKNFDAIRTNLSHAKPVVVNSNSVIARSPTGSGHSGGENMAKGLAGGHSYSVLDTKEQDGKRFVKLYNPWGQTGRVYNFGANKAAGEHVAAEVEDAAEFWLELSDLSKRFSQIIVGKKITK